MLHYDTHSWNWMPYVMYTNQPDIRSEICNTDEHGFRFTGFDGGWIDHEAFQKLDRRKALICGGSTAFGVGTSNDGQTLASLLNQQSDTVWFNYGSRGFNSTQELLLFSFYMPKVEQVVLFSGVNNLVDNMLSEHFSPPFGTFFGRSTFDRLNIPFTRFEALRRLVPRKIRSLLPQAGLPEVRTTNIEQRFEESLSVTEHDLEMWRILSDALGFSVSYFLQPFASWTGKRFCDEEVELFEILDRQQGGQWQTIYPRVTASYETYATRLEAMCQAKGIMFVDSNKLFPHEGWLFCDRVHFTDEGHVAAAGAIRSALRQSC